MPQMLMQHDIDPALDIKKRIGNLKDFTLFGNQILVGVYLRPDKGKEIKRNDGTVTNLYIPDQTRTEDKHQGKAALVLLKGPSAFVSDEHYDFKGQNVKVGDWVSLFVSDGRSIVINGVLCRVLEDQHIRLKIPAPDVVY